MLYSSFLFISPSLSLFSANSLVIILGGLFLVSILKNKAKIINLSGLETFKRKYFIYVLLVYTLLACLWSPNVWEGVVLFFRILILSVMGVVCWFSNSNGMVIKCDKEKALGLYFIGSFVCALILIGIEIYMNGYISSIFHIYDSDYLSTYNNSALNRGVAFLTLFVWSVVYLLISNKNYLLLCVLLTVFGAALIFYLDSQTATFSFILVTCCFLLCLLFQKKGMYFCLVTLVVGIVSVPTLIHVLGPERIAHDTKELHIPSSFIHRMFIWDFALGEAAKRPIHGWGFDSSRYISKSTNAKVPVNWGLEIEDKEKFEWGDPHIMPLHPHNGTLQIGLELGLIGVLGYIFVILYIGRAIINSKFSNIEKNCLFALFLQIVAMQQTGFGIWQNWFWAAVIISLVSLSVAIKARSLGSRN